MTAPRPARPPLHAMTPPPTTIEELALEASLIHEQIARHAALAGVLQRDGDGEDLSAADDRGWLTGMLADGLALLDGRADSLQARMRESATSARSRSLRMVKGRRRDGR